MEPPMPSDTPPPRPLPSEPSIETEEGARTALITRIIIVVTVIVGQLWALTVTLEAFLSGHTGRAWWLALFSAVSFAVVGVLVFLEPASRSRPRSGSHPGVRR
jgi:hypothetical protein